MKGLNNINFKVDQEEMVRFTLQIAHQDNQFDNSPIFMLQYSIIAEAKAEKDRVAHHSVNREETLRLRGFWRERVTASLELARDDRARGARYSQESLAFHEVTGCRLVTRVVPREELSSLWG